MKRGSIEAADRLAVRTCPSGWPVMYQSWGELLFMHWPVPVDSLRPLIPEPLVIDTFDGVAWVGITPFTMWGLRSVLLPAVPFLSKSHELNVRTYVHLDGVPGVWFFSLDANNPLAVWGARLAFHLPYFAARMSIERRDHTLHFASRRTHRHSAPAGFEASWTVGDRLPQPEPGSLDFFLIERYCLYAARGDNLYRVRIFHRPWPLHAARLITCRSTMLESQGLPSPEGEPLLHRTDKAVRNARDAFVTEHMEIAAYEVLERLAERAGDAETVEVARKNRAEEVAMANRIASKWDNFLEVMLSEEGMRN